MRARLLCRTGELSGATFDIAEEATIGRAQTNTIVLGTRVVSQQHARIAFDAGREAYVVEDLDSRNGTRVDGRPVREPTRLGSLHVITFGNLHDFVFQALSPDDVSAPPRRGTASETRAEAAPAIQVPPGLGGDPAAPEPAVEKGGTVVDAGAFQIPAGVGAPADPSSDTRVEVGVPVLPTALRSEAPGTVPPPPSPAAVARFVFEIDDAEGRRTVELTAGQRIAGRSPRCDLVLSGRTLSREHAVFTLGPGRVTVSDLESQNGTFVAGQRVAGEARVEPGTVVTLGDRARVTFIKEA